MMWVVTEAYGELLSGAHVGDLIPDPVELLKKDPRLHMQYKRSGDESWLQLAPAAVGGRYGAPRTIVLMEADQ